jgi:2-hydroxymuconate-semialdehyde hydrolase
MSIKKTVKAGGYVVSYLEQGTGTPLLLVHGITTYSFIWKDMIPGLSSGFRVLAIDLLGCGDSEKPQDASYSISAQTDLVSDFMDALDIKKVHLVAHDIGGGIGQIFALRYPDKIGSLTLINTIGYDYWPVQPITTMRIPIFREIGLAAIDHGFFKLLIKRGVYHKERVTDDVVGLFKAPLKTPEGRRGFLRLAKHLDNRQLMEIEKDIKKLTLPVLIIRGDKDPYLPADISQRLQRDIKGSKLAVVETGGHFIQLDEPEMLVEMITQFIKAS